MELAWELSDGNLWMNQAEGGKICKEKNDFESVSVGLRGLQRLMGPFKTCGSALPGMLLCFF